MWSARSLYLPDGVVSPEQVEQTFTLIRAHLPLPATSRVPPPDELLRTMSRRTFTPGARAR